MKLQNLDKLLEICNEFSENHEKYGFSEFDIVIQICGDRSFSLEFEFAVIGAVPIYITPDLLIPISQWYYCSNNWMNEKGKQTIINWIIENSEIFGIKSGCDETAHYRCLG